MRAPDDERADARMTQFERAERPTARLSPRPAVVLALIAGAALLALVLRLLQAPAPMTYDEYASLYFSERPFSDLWGWWMVRETNPPLFYSLLRLWRMLVPESQAALRLLPLLLSLAQIALLARFVGKRYGGFAAALCVLLLALSPSDIFQSEYVRGYVLAKLAATVSFIGLVAALDRPERRWRGWALYAGGAAVAIYSHTTMLLWPAIASLAVLAEAAARRGVGRRDLARLAIADAAIVALSGWVLWLAVVQMRTRAANISWLQPLSLDDYVSSANLQLLLDGWGSSALMAVLIFVGVARTFRDRATRLALVIVVATLVGFKAADAIHPITSDYTLHWCASFTTLLAAAALAKPTRAEPARRRRLRLGASALALAALLADGLYELEEVVWIPEPQDWRTTIRTVANAPDAALLVSHESVGLVVEQACMLEFHTRGCPFPLVVMANPAQSDSWSFGGYGGAIVPKPAVLAALRPARRVYAFSRYVYTPLDPFGLDPGDYREVQWDDGELIGPIPIEHFVRPP